MNSCVEDTGTAAFLLRRLSVVRWESEREVSASDLELRAVEEDTDAPVD